MRALDELLQAWRKNPDAGSTLALCSYLGTAPREELVREIGAQAEVWHKHDAEVMLAVGRMYLDAAMFSEAQGALVAAGKNAAQNPVVYRLLGEVLLRRGDALRAEKVLARALGLGDGSPEARLWHDRAVVYVALQKRVGVHAVATEVARAVPRVTSIPPPAMPSSDVFGQREPPTIPNAPAARGISALLEGEVPAPPRAPSFDELTPILTPGTPAARPSQPVAPSRVSRSTMPTALASEPPYPAAAAAPARVAAGSRLRTPARPPLSERAPSSRRLGPPSPAALASAPAIVQPPAVAQPHAVAAVPTPPPPAAVALAPPLAAPPSAMPAQRPLPVTFHDEPDASPELVLGELAKVGVFEPHGGAPPAWEAASRQRSRGVWVFLIATVLAAGAGTGAWFYAQKVKRERMELAQRIGDEVHAMLHGGRLDQLTATDEKLARVFDLDSRSRRAARLWLENRVIGALLLPGEARGIDSALHRARTVGLPEEETAFGTVASFLTEGDLPGAAAALSKHDKRAGRDALYQLVAGVALERAGDGRALERYEAATKLDPSLVPAHALFAALALIELGAEKAAPATDALARRAPGEASTKAVRLLAWAVAPGEASEPPAEARLSPAERERVPMPLRAALRVADARSAGDARLASEALSAAVAASSSPAVATWVGLVAIDSGEERVARDAALRALRFSALYPRARVLASRVALLGGRLDEARSAVEQLDPKSPDVAVVRAAAAYETLDATELASAAEVLPAAVEALAALRLAPLVVRGGRLPSTAALEKLASPRVPWGDLVAVDAALDGGQLELADRIVARWGAAARRPAWAIRIARLRRHQDRLDDALAALRERDEGPIGARALIEEVLVHAGRGDARAARELIARHPSVLGPASAWLSVIADAAGGQVAEAGVKLAQLEPVPDAAPLPLRVLVARALSAGNDKRAKAWVGSLVKQFPKHPDLLLAANPKRSR